ncbi:MAG: hypothetical protein R2911_30795 [Caldilineaceae bacterium]
MKAPSRCLEAQLDRFLFKMHLGYLSAVAQESAKAAQPAPTPSH